MAKPVEDSIVKTYNAEERNAGKHNLVLTNEYGEAEFVNKNIHEQLVKRTLRNVLPERLTVEYAETAALGPPDIRIGEEIAVEVTAPNAVSDGGLDLSRAGEAVRKKLESLRKAWRREGEGRGKYLKKYRECWVAVVLPFHGTWGRVSNYSDEVWKRILGTNQERFDNWMRETIRQDSLRDPVISRILVVLEPNLIFWEGILYVYSTRALIQTNSTEIKELGTKADHSEIIEKVVNGEAIQLTGVVKQWTEKKVRLENEAKLVVGATPKRT